MHSNKGKMHHKHRTNRADNREPNNNEKNKAMKQSGNI